MMAKLYRPNKESLITFVVLSMVLHGLIYSFPSDLFLKAPEYPEPVIQVSIVSEAAPASVPIAESQDMKKPAEKQIVKKEPVKKEVVKQEVKPQPILEKPVKVAKKEIEEYKPVNLNSLQPASFKQPEYTDSKPEEPVYQQPETASFQNELASESASINSPTSNDNGKQAVTVEPMLSPADYIQTSQPHYPKRAIDRGIQGTVIVKALINSYGTAEDLKISSSSGHEMLDDSAIKAVSKWRFKPSILAGHAQEMWVQVPVKFVIR